MGPNWFALSVKPRHEKVAAIHLRMRGLEEFLPLQPVRRTWSDRKQTVELPLFPGYVFCRFTYQERLQALNTPGITAIVGFGKKEIPIDESEIASVRLLVSSGLPVSPWPYLRPGQAVRIERGALEGARGTIVRGRSPWRLVVSIELLNRSVAVEIDRELLEPLREPPRRCGHQLSC